MLPASTALAEYFRSAALSSSSPRRRSTWHTGLWADRGGRWSLAPVQRPGVRTLRPCELPERTLAILSSWLRAAAQAVRRPPNIRRRVRCNQKLGGADDALRTHYSSSPETLRWSLRSDWLGADFANARAVFLSINLSNGEK